MRRRYLSLARAHKVTPAAPHLLTPPEQMKSQVLRARDEGERLASDPPDESEPFRFPPRSEQHPRVTERSRRNRARRERREERENQLHGSEPTYEDDREDGPPDDGRWPPDYTYWKQQHGDD